MKLKSETGSRRVVEILKASGAFDPGSIPGGSTFEIF